MAWQAHRRGTCMTFQPSHHREGAEPSSGPWPESDGPASRADSPAADPAPADSTSANTLSAALIARAMAGDQHALADLWTAHRRYAATVILAHKPASADLEDLLQETARSMLAKVHTLSDPASFLPWLRMVALNVARLAGRKHAANKVAYGLDAAHEADASPSLSPASSRIASASHAAPAPVDSRAHPADATVLAAHADDLLALSERIPEDYREPLLLKCLRNMSYREIAATLGLSETTVETRIARARRMLRELASAAEDGRPLVARISAPPSASAGPSAGPRRAAHPDA
ncbi:MAG: RNA polymerase sigma factor [bacterium]